MTVVTLKFSSKDAAGVFGRTHLLPYRSKEVFAPNPNVARKALSIRFQPLGNGLWSREDGVTVQAPV